jgi:hypothetical protein
VSSWTRSLALRNVAFEVHDLQAAVGIIVSLAERTG